MPAPGMAGDRGLELGVLLSGVLTMVLTLVFSVQGADKAEGRPKWA